MGYSKTKRSGNKSVMKKKFRKAKGKNKRQDQRLKRLEKVVLPSIEYKYTGWFINRSLLSWIEPRTYELTAMKNNLPVGAEPDDRIGNKITMKYIRVAMKFSNIRSSQQIRCLVVQFPAMQDLVTNRLLNYVIEERPTANGESGADPVINPSGPSVDTYNNPLNDADANRCILGPLKTDSLVNYILLDDFKVSTTQPNEVNISTSNDGDTVIVNKIYKPKKCQLEYPYSSTVSTPSANKNCIALFICAVDDSTGTNRLSLDLSYRMKYYDF